MSKIEVDKIDPQSGTALEVGTSGDTVTVPSGVTLTTTNATLNLPTTITSTTEVKTNKVSPATGVAFSLGDSGDTFTVPSGATLANLGTATGFPETDLAPVNQDIITLALRQSVDNNSAKYNLPHAAVTQFESDADYDAAGSTDISRNAAEYISSVSVANSYTTTAGTPASNLTLGSGSWTGALTNDYTSGGGVGMYPDFLYDLAADWKIRVFNNDSSGDPRNTNGGYGMYCAVVTPDTSVAAGANPTVLRDQDASLGQSYGNWTPTQLRDQWLTDAYGGTIGTDAMSDNYASMSNNQSVDASSGATARGYNASTTNKNYGQQVTYDRGANTITIQPSNSADFSTMYGTSSCTFTSVPAAGRFMFYAGYANGSVDYVSTTRNSADNTIFGYFSTSSVSATGTALGTTNVPTAAVTSVSGVMLMKNAFGTNTLGTDVKVYFTADNSNWTEATSYTSAGTFSTGITQITLGQTTVTSGSDVRWKIIFANQSASSKEAYIYGMGTNY